MTPDPEDVGPRMSAEQLRRAQQPLKEERRAARGRDMWQRGEALETSKSLSGTVAWGVSCLRFSAPGKCIVDSVRSINDNRTFLG